MEAENITFNNEQDYGFSKLKSYPYTIQLTLSGDSSNCKLSYLHKVGNLSQVKDDKEKDEIIKFLMERAKGCIILNTTNKDVAKFIKNTYKVYYYHEVPIGYSGGFQYHICIKNTVRPNEYCKDPQEETGFFDKAHIKEKLIKLLGIKRRKSDYIDEFIDSL